MVLFCNYSKYNIYFCTVFRVITVIYIHGIPIKIVTYINKRKLFMADLIRLKWEYKVVGRISERDMNNLGQDGWELVNVTFYNNGTICDMIFKRQIIERINVVNDAFNENV